MLGVEFCVWGQMTALLRTIALESRALGFILHQVSLQGLLNLSCLWPCDQRETLVAWL